MPYVFYSLLILVFLFCAADSFLGLNLLFADLRSRLSPAMQSLFRWLSGSGYLLIAISFGMRLFAPLFQNGILQYAGIVFIAGDVVVVIALIIALCRKGKG